MNIGTKIKTVRKLKQLTQAELSDGIVTRNMLSAIENGNALPSLDTLIALAKRLSVPAGYFLNDEDEDFAFSKPTYIDELKSLLRSKDYAECIRLCEEEIPGTDDEISLIAAESYTALAKAQFNIGNFTSAKKYIGKAMAQIKKTIYRTDILKQNCEFLLLLMNSIKDFGHGKRITNTVDFDFPIPEYFYIKALDLYNGGRESEADGIRHKLSSLPLPEAMQDHLLARQEIYEGSITEALERLFTIEKSKSDSLSLFALCSIYQDMEFCFNLQEDFRMAYVYAKKRGDKLSSIR
ncbi:MAG: helix-turn-helix transcriptional regulator [Clostridia bacterium]|nr:helix-turn-helix transcriptional regulator [Clostridia bacterium]